MEYFVSGVNIHHIILGTGVNVRLSPVCLYLWKVGSLHLKMLFMEQCAKLEFCVLLY
jgi:hypothetical protein